MSARYLLCCWPFPGHVNPNVAVARALRERGHDVAFYTGEEARATIEGQGFEVHGFERVAAAWEPVRELERRAAGQRGKWRAQAAAFRGCAASARSAPRSPTSSRSSSARSPTRS